MKDLKRLTRTLLTAGLMSASLSGYAGNWQLGSGIYDITGPAGDTTMLGYGELSQKVRGIHTRLWSRAYAIESSANGEMVIFVSADLHNMPQGVKQGVMKKLNRTYGERFNDANVMLTATHTHTGPGGFDHYILLNAGTLGYDKPHYDAIVEGIFQSIKRAIETREPGEIYFNKGELADTAVNRNPGAYDLNPDRGQYGNSRVNENMTLLKLVSDGGEEIGSINWFGVHNTSFGKHQQQISGDNKGIASQLFEKSKGSNYQQDSTFVAAFANSTLGDISPNYCGQRNGCRYTEAESALLSATKQFEKAQQLYRDANVTLSNELQIRHQYVYLPEYSVTEEFGYEQQAARICEGEFGLSFLAGSWHDGYAATLGTWEGMSLATSVGFALPGLHWFAPISFRQISRKICQYPKPGFVANNTHLGDLYTSYIPFQLFTLGELAIVSVAGEMSTMAGRRLESQLLDQLSSIGVEHVVIAGLANAYHGYITTPEEYQAQRYEGAHTIFGPNTASAYMQIYSELADALVSGRRVNAGPTPPDLSLHQRLLVTPPLVDLLPPFEHFGQVHQDANDGYLVNDEVWVKFRAGTPNNHYMTQNSFLEVQRWHNGEWQTYRTDNDIDTTFVWYKDPNPLCVQCSFAEVKWTPDNQTPTGMYRIVHKGHWRDAVMQHYYEGYSKDFFVANVRNQVALSSSHGQYLSAVNNGGQGLDANGQAIDSWEIFGVVRFEEAFSVTQANQCIRHGDLIGLRTGNGHYISAPGNGDLDANRPHFRAWEQFRLVNLSNPAGCWQSTDAIALYHPSSQKFVAAEPTGQAVAKWGAINAWETFGLTLIEEKLKHSQISLLSSHGTYVSADQAGGGPVFANQGHMLKWERFQLRTLEPDNLSNCVRSGDRISLRTDKGHFFSARSQGDLLADGKRLAEWEKFTLHNHTRSGCLQYGDSISLQSTHGKYMMADANGPKKVSAGSHHMQAWETFNIIIH
ncbi:neutral/alkaline non-lysosomal ceramidase N-terminal domain-containing protein [Shewanella corallii]|uniref:Neutral ceramidase n=1 Tax=Shewanella corallii TaxID=560080 RepID=A0ABT0N3L3_9GAMM|nr:neutral/alkaline non-lysosomal ceramidase N-terminal domain-containing protein [Shewanella corallii]MCL2913013.1 neutral/alkaline non-lysosomal ceramidase N-terminal domain-containing protein [Shewanella corallii]